MRSCSRPPSGPAAGCAGSGAGWQRPGDSATGPAAATGPGGGTARRLRPAAVETPGGTRRWQPADGAGAGHGGGRGTSRPTCGGDRHLRLDGEPKGAQLAASALLHSARASLDRIGAGAGERWLCPLPTSHVAGLGICAVAGRRDHAGGSARLDDGACPAAAAARTPRWCRPSCAAAGGRGRPDRFGTILLGGAAVPAALLAAARAAGARVVTTYGMTETCGGCVYDGCRSNGVRSVPARRQIEITGPSVLRVPLRPT
jgi:O-succinylbenzoic acid--CoA ligase